MSGVIAKKIGMTRIICPESGKVTPVTVLEVPSMKVLQVKTKDKDGYSAVVLGAFPKNNKSAKNISKKFNIIKEIATAEGMDLKKGDDVNLNCLENVDKVSISGVSKGRGFAGVIKRYNFSRGPETHGSHHHREPGSVGTCAKPARILKGRKMPGHFGVEKNTFRGKIASIDQDKNLIAVNGSVPGSKNSFVTIISI